MNILAVAWWMYSEKWIKSISSGTLSGTLYCLSTLTTALLQFYAHQESNFLYVRYELNVSVLSDYKT